MLISLLLGVQVIAGSGLTLEELNERITALESCSVLETCSEDVNVEEGCYISSCGCPGSFLDPTWCGGETNGMVNAQMGISDWCAASNDNCIACGGMWCVSETEAPADDGTCLTGSEPTGWTTPPVFAPLSEEEMNEAFQALRAEGYLSTEIGQSAALGDNYVYGMALENPSKADALAGTARRFADVHVHRGIDNDLAEFVVGPLGEGNLATVTLRSTHAYNARPRDGVEWDQFEVKVFQAYDVLNTLLVESFDGAVAGDGLYFHPQAPPGLGANDRETRFCAALAPAGMARGRDMHFLPLTGTVSNPGQDTSTWYVYDLYYLNQGPFNTAEDLMAAYNAGTIRKVVLPQGYRDNLFERTMPQPLLGGIIDGYRPSSQMPGPTLSQNKQRFTVDGHKIDYMGWTFEIGASQYKGPNVNAVKYKGQSVAHEIALSEVGVVYSSDTSSGSNTVYLDATFGIGEFQDLIPGVDCPKYSTILEAAWFNGYEQQPVTARTTCVFEVYNGKPLWRRKDKFASGARNHHLVVRTPMAVGNYDYIISYEFHLDGRIKVEGSAGGFLQTTFWDAANPHMPVGASRDPFGFRVSDYTHGSMHDHSLGFKVDLDVLGTQNTFKTYEWTSGTPVEAFNSQDGIHMTEQPPYMLYGETRYFKETTIEEETGLNVNLQTPKFWVVENEAEQNEWGANRGYRLIPNNLPPTQVLRGSHPAVSALGYTQYHAMLTKRKESERFLTGNYDLNQLLEPEIDARTYLNNENVQNDDLVLWVNCGFLHIPTSEDVPMTNLVEASFTLKPFNFFDMDDVFDLPSYVDTKENAPVDIHTREPTADDCQGDTSQGDYFDFAHTSEST